MKLITVSGLRNSGKTTLIRELVAGLHRSGKTAAVIENERGEAVYDAEFLSRSVRDKRR